MKAPDLKKWDLKYEMEGLLFFAQSINELLFDYTIDTYKIPALNSRSLTEESLHSIEDCEANFLKYGTIKPIIKELEDRLQKDLVVIEILKDYFEEFLKFLRTDNSLPDLKTKIMFLNNKIRDSYLSMSKVLLKKAILNPKEKEKIAGLTRIFITELISQGYAPEFIYFESERFFFTGTFPPVSATPMSLINILLFSH